MSIARHLEFWKLGRFHDNALFENQSASEFDNWLM